MILLRLNTTQSESRSKLFRSFQGNVFVGIKKGCSIFEAIEYISADLCNTLMEV